MSDTPSVDTPTVDTAPATAERMAALWADPPGLKGRLMAVQNDTIGKRLLFVGFFFLLLGGSVDSLVMRLQLAFPENDFISPELYNELFTNHGSVTMFLVILPITEGFAILMLPFLLGTREMPFPRLGAYSFFTYLMGGLFYYSSTLFQAVPERRLVRLHATQPDRFSPELTLDFWVLGLSVAEVAAIAAGIEIIISILKFRAPGMTLSRMPLFAWAMLVTAFMIVFAFTTLVVGSLLLELSRSFDMKFFDPEAGGSSLLWQHLFWIFGHPEVYIQFLPAAGVVSMILPVLVRRKIAGYRWLVAAFVAIGFMSFALWAHHMFAVGLPPIVLQLLLRRQHRHRRAGRHPDLRLARHDGSGRPVWKTPLLFVVGFIITFVIGGITGVMVASAPFDLQAHDSYFVVGHLHYVLIGGVAFPIFAAAYYWLPKYTGKLLDERLGKINFWLMFIGLNVTFFPMHIVGLIGMPRRVYTYDAGTGVGPLQPHVDDRRVRAVRRDHRVHRQPRVQPLPRRARRRQPVGRRHAGVVGVVAAARPGLLGAADRAQPPPAVGPGRPAHRRAAHVGVARAPRPMAAHVARALVTGTNLAEPEEVIRVRPVDLAVRRRLRHGPALHRRDGPPAWR